MNDSWASKYIGAEFQDGGRGPKYDCWGLLRKVYSDEFGIELISYKADYSDTKDYKAIFSLFQEEHNNWSAVIGEPRVGDAIALRIVGLPIHFGIVCGDGKFIHTLEETNAVIERYDSPRWKSRVTGFWRHKEMRP